MSSAGPFPNANPPADSLLARVGRRLRRTPLPGPLTNLLLMLRWRCRIHPLAKIHYPAALQLGRGAYVGRCTLKCQGFRGGHIRLGQGVYLHDHVVLDVMDGFIDIGEHSSVHPFCVLYGNGGITLGAQCAVATHTVIVASNHTFERDDRPIRQQPIRARGITIDDDVWLGAGCRILDGVHIGHGSVVGAGAVVTRSFVPGSVIAGVPARATRNRHRNPA